MKMKHLLVLPLCLLALPCVNAHAGTWAAVAPLGVKPKADFAGAAVTVTNAFSTDPDMDDYKEDTFYYAYTRANPADAPGNMLGVYTFKHTGGTATATLNGGDAAFASMNMITEMGSVYSTDQTYYGAIKDIAIYDGDPVLTDTKTITAQTTDVYKSIGITPVNDIANLIVSAYGYNSYQHNGAPSGTFSLPTMSLEVTGVALANP